MAQEYSQKAKTIAKGSSILIDDHPCKVRSIEYSVAKRYKPNEYTCKFDAYDIFDLTTHTTQAKATALCMCPFVRDNVYQIWQISNDGQMVVESLADGTWGNMTLPDPGLLPHPHVPNADGTPDPDEDATFITHYQTKLQTRNLFLEVKYVMGREHIIGIMEQLEEPPQSSESLYH